MSVTPTQVTVSTSVPTLTLAAGTTGGVAVANSIDASNDYLLIYTHSSTATQGINRNTLLGISSQPVGISDSQTLTNKTLTSPTISGPTLSGTVGGTYTLGGVPTFPSGVTQNTATQTLTNKTLTSPTINSPTITNATISADAVTGYTTSNSGTIYGIAVTTGVITGSGTVGSGANVTNGIQAAALAATAITIGYEAITSDQNGFSTLVAVTGLSASVTVPAGGRRLEIEAHLPSVQQLTAAANVTVSIWDGTVGSGTQLQADVLTLPTNYSGAFTVKAYPAPSAGSKTYNVGIATATDTANILSSSTSPSTLIVKVI
jgi:hypothetical protein